MMPRKRTAWFVGNVAQRAAHDGNTPLVRDWREGEPLIRVTARIVPPAGAAPGGLGPKPKGSTGLNGMRALNATGGHVPRPWANAKHEREIARRLRQRGAVVISVTMRAAA
jgi:hypothetical protein